MLDVQDVCGCKTSSEYAKDITMIAEQEWRQHSHKMSKETAKQEYKLKKEKTDQFVAA